jgi:TIR domain
MQLSSETSRAAALLREIFESGKTLTLSEPMRCSGGNSYAFVVSAGGKETDFCLSREQLDDTPATPGYREAAEALARSFESRFRNTDPNHFVTGSGRVLYISPEWPALPLALPGGGYLAAMGYRVPIKDVLSGEIAICHVVITHRQTLPSPDTTPYHRLPAIINSIRADVDAGMIVFHPSFEEHPRVMQNVDFRYDAVTPEPISLSRYLQQKVWLLGFRSGQKNTKVWVTDPWDASYLASTVALLRQEVAILDAQGFISLDDAENFASTGKRLLAQHGPHPPKPASAPAATTASQAHPDFDVFISHSTADKPYVEPLVKALEAAGVSVWFDKSAMEWGDSLRSEIDRGLASCRYGIVVFSRAFLNKKRWTEHELNALFAKEEPGKKVILPIWHGITRDDLIQYSPAFADRLAKNSVADSYDDIVSSLLGMLGRLIMPSEPIPAISPKPDAQTLPKPYGKRSDEKEAMDGNPEAVLPKVGNGRFRAKDEAIGFYWDTIPFAKDPGLEIFLNEGPVLWMRMRSAKGIQHDFDNDTLMRCVQIPNVPLQPLSWSNMQYLRAIDGVGTYETHDPTNRSTASSSICFAFSHGEVWAADTALLSYGNKNLYFVNIVRGLAPRFRGYAEFLSCLGLSGPFEWSVGIDDVKHWMLQVPSPQHHVSTSAGHRCLRDNVLGNGTYELGASVPKALMPFLNRLFRACGTSVPGHIDQLIHLSGIR